MGQDDWIDGRLSMAEEVVLLTLDDATGEFRDLPPGGMGVALGGAMLMDLALADRIDSDLTRLFAVSQEPTGDEVLDGVLGDIARKDSGADDESAEENPDWGTFLWVEELARRGDAYRDRLLDRLVGRGVLRIEDTRVLWVFGSRARHPADRACECYRHSRVRAGCPRTDRGQRPDRADHRAGGDQPVGDAGGL